MQPTFKSLQISKNLGISTHTIRRWVGRFPEYFCEHARLAFRNRAVYTSDELRVLITIAELSAAGYGLKNIGDMLAEGYRSETRLEEFKPKPPEETNVSSKINSHSEDEVVEKRDDLESQMLQRIAELTDRLTEAQYKLGIAEGKLEILLQQKNP